MTKIRSANLTFSSRDCDKDEFNFIISFPKDRHGLKSTKDILSIMESIIKESEPPTPPTKAGVRERP